MLILLLVCIVSNNACSKKNTVGTDDSATTTEPDLQPSRANLWLHHKAVQGALRYTHKAVTTGGWPEKCELDLNATDPADRDIMCMTETTELDLMALGLTLEYNVPTHVKCPYVVTMSPYFFQFEAPKNDSGGASPSAYPHLPPAYVEVVDDQRTSGGTGFNAVGYYSVADSVTNPTPTRNPYLKGGKSSGTYLCGFDYSDAEGGPNCCSGRFIERRTTITDSSSTTTYSTQEWPGHPSNCLGGIGLELNPNIGGKSRWPSPIIWRMQDQVDQSINPSVKKGFQSPIDLLKSASPRLMAEEGKETKNFGAFEISKRLPTFGTTRSVATYFTGTTPRAFSDILDYYTSSSFKDPRYFTVICVDYAEEVTARIRLRIREWNTYAALKNATEPTANEDDEVGNEDEFPEFGKGDYVDWNDTSGWWGPWKDTDSNTVPDYYWGNDQATFPGFTL